MAVLRLHRRVLGVLCTLLVLYIHILVLSTIHFDYRHFVHRRTLSSHNTTKASSKDLDENSLVTKGATVWDLLSDIDGIRGKYFNRSRQKETTLTWKIQYQ